MKSHYELSLVNEKDGSRITMMISSIGNGFIVDGIEFGRFRLNLLKDGIVKITTRPVPYANDIGMPQEISLSEKALQDFIQALLMYQIERINNNWQNDNTATNP